MAILINKDSKVIVLGITGKSGALQTKAMLDAGTDIVAGVTPGKGGQEVYGVPVYNFVSEAAAEHEFDTAICFVPPFAAKDSCYEAIDAGVGLVVLTTEEMELNDSVEIIEYAHAHGATLVGPGCAGVLAPEECKVGAHPIEASSRAVSKCFIFMYFLLPHWVLATWRSRAQTSIKAELPSGKQPTTLVLRRISRFSRSITLLVRIRVQCSEGKSQ